jgi:Ca2+-binding RTX toxin-like protein
MRGSGFVLSVVAASLAWPSVGWCTYTIDLTSGNDTYYIGCVYKSGVNRIWGCNANTGTMTQINPDCVMDEDIHINGLGGVDTIAVGHGTENGFGSTYYCGNTQYSFGQITHTWGQNTWEIVVQGNDGNDYLWGDDSTDTLVLGGNGDDELRQFGSARLGGDANGDRLFSPNWVTPLEEMSGDTGSDCLQDDPDAMNMHGYEPEATFFDCGITTGNDYVTCCDSHSPGQPDTACSHLVSTCEVGPGAPVGGGGAGEGG